jgi:gag-polypeptide of LTR copia-type
MSRKFPNLKTKYELKDDDYEPPSSSASPAQSRQRLTRQAKVSDETETSPSRSFEFETSNPFFSLSFSDEEENPTEPISSTFITHRKPSKQKMPATQQEIQTAVEAYLTNNPHLLRTGTKSAPKLDVPHLTEHNYEDWSRKMLVALQLQGYWIDPDTRVADLNLQQQELNKLAALYVQFFLDKSFSTLVTATNRDNFILLWSEIKNFAKPRTATVLTDVYYTIQYIKHKSGTSIREHIMKMEAQFRRFKDVDETVSEKHLVALLLASVKESEEFASIFQMAMWEDNSTLTVSKVKSMLISIDSNSKADATTEAHYNARKSSNNQSTRRHNRVPRNLTKGFDCPICERDNHTAAECYKAKKKTSQQRHSSNHRTQRGMYNANLAEQSNENTHDVQVAYVGMSTTNHSPITFTPTTSQKRKSPMTTPSGGSSSVKQRLGGKQNDLVNSPSSELSETDFISFMQDSEDEDSLLRSRKTSYQSYKLLPDSNQFNPTQLSESMLTNS